MEIRKIAQTGIEAKRVTPPVVEREQEPVLVTETGATAAPVAEVAAEEDPQVEDPEAVRAVDLVVARAAALDKVRRLRADKRQLAV